MVLLTSEEDDFPQSLQDLETTCSAREDGIHFTCWYDGEFCCVCKEG